MSEHRLPPDSSLWPKEPFELLGVGKDVDRRRLKQAYVALIRNFKPERFPNEFRLIREAYEAALSFLEWRGDIPGNDDRTSDVRSIDESASDDPPVVEPEPLPERSGAGQETLAEMGQGEPIAKADANGEARETSRRERPPVIDLETELDATWAWACDGRDIEAYRRLSELATQRPGHEELVLRLYWLLWSDPRLDPDRLAMDWLARGLSCGVHGYRVRQLLIREVAEEPQRAMLPQIERLLETIRDAHARWEVASARWRAAAKLGRGELISQDLEALRAKLQADESIWQGLLFEAVEQLAWSTQADHRETLQRYWRELHQMDMFKPAAVAEMDRLEFVLSLTEAWRTMRKAKDIPRELAECLWAGWAGPERCSLKAAEEAARLLNRDRLAALSIIDRMRSIGPALVVQLRGALGRLEREAVSDTVPPADAVSLATALEGILWRNRTPDYAQLRGRFLDFCLSEMIAPDQVATLLENSSDGQLAVVQTIVDRLRHDLSLDCVFASYAMYCS